MRNGLGRHGAAAHRYFRVHPIAAQAALLSMGLLGSFAAHADGLPTGGEIVAGSGRISQTGSVLDVHQDSARLIANWQRFDIGAGNTVNFHQPSSSAVALNRVLGNDASRIYGSLNANGQVFLVNPNGVLFGRGASVDVGGLVASTLDIGNDDFLAGRYIFKGPGSHLAGGTVENLGSIRADGGIVALLGGTVRNDGVIHARLGSVALAAGNEIALDFAGDGLLHLTVEASALDALVENRQLIRADGGSVLLTARATDALLQTVVNNEGLIEARTLEDRGGRIVLLGGPDGGTTRVAGRLDASAPDGGDGGFVETSGAYVDIAADARVTTRSETGRTGTWLIDPTDFTIHAGTDGRTDSGIGVVTLQNNLVDNHVEIATAVTGNGAGDIHVDADLRWNAATTLTLTAHRDIRINAPITVEHAGGGLALNHGGGAAYHVNAPISFIAGSTDTAVNALAGFRVNDQVFTLIHDVGQLQAMNDDLAGHYALARDIDASATAGWNGGDGFRPIGAGGSTVFQGVFDGLGHAIDGLTQNTTAGAVGLFGSVRGANLRNVGLTRVNILGTGQRSDVGALAGVVDNSVITRVFSSGDVQGVDVVGGLVGYAASGLSSVTRISQSYSVASVSSDNGLATVGDFLGLAQGNVLVNQSYSTGAGGAVTLYGSETLAGHEMFDASNYAGFDFDGVWANAGDQTTPYLRSMNANQVINRNDLPAGGNPPSLYTVIQHVDQLQAMATRRSGDYLLGNDIDAFVTAGWNGGTGFMPVGDVSSSFTGRFDGLGHAIDGLFIHRDVLAPVGLFGVTDGAVLRNIGLRNVTVTGGPQGTGALVGQAYATAISGSYVDGGSVTTTSRMVGGLAGSIDAASSIDGSYARIDVTAQGGGGASDASAGGLVGVSGGTIANSYATGRVIGGEAINGWIGGLVGLQTGGSIATSYAAGQVDGAGQTGGLVGYQQAGSVTQSYWNVESTGQASSAGSAAGFGLSSEGMRQLASFAGWDISAQGGQTSVWRIYEGHTAPLLREFLTPLTLLPAYEGNGAPLADIGALHLPDGADVSRIFDLRQDRSLRLSSTDAGEYRASIAADGLYSDQRGYDLIVADRIVATPGSAVGDIHLSNGLRWDTGTLVIDTAGRIDDAGAIVSSGGTFVLRNGDWSQLGVLAEFDVHDFRIVGGTFLRAAGGSGTQDDAYEIADVYGLQGMTSVALLNRHFAQAGDIDAGVTANWNGGRGFRPIGSTNNPRFSGSFDGRGHIIDGLTMKPHAVDILAPSAYVGLFGMAGPGAVIRNVGLENVDIAVLGIDYGNHFVGALLGYNLGASIENSYATGRVGIVDGNTDYIGGLVGYHVEGSIAGSHADVDVTSVKGFYSWAGGLVGLNGDDAAITRSHASGDVTVTGSNQTGVGGLAGENSGLIELSYATGDVEATDARMDGWVGGLVGSDSVGEIRQSYATGNATVQGRGSSNTVSAGGLVGRGVDTLIEQSYATGDVSASDSYDNTAGGLLGTGDASIRQSYALGRAQASGGQYADAGGLIGLNDGSSAVASFWNADANAGGIGYGNNVSGAQGKSLAQLRSIETFAAWGANISDVGGAATAWRIYDNQSTPLLRALLTRLDVVVNDDTVTYDGSIQTGDAGYTIADPYDADRLLGSGVVTGGGRDAGDYTLTLAGLYSGQQGYDLVIDDGTLTIEKAELTLTADGGATKIYGGTHGFAGDEYTITQGTLYTDAGDAIASVDLDSAGAANTAGVGTYDITIANAAGTGLHNYTIRYVNAADGLQVTPKTLTITAAGGAGKVYGSAYAFAGSEYTQSGLEAWDRLDGVSLSSDGALATANVGFYDIAIANAQGVGLDNYAVTYVAATNGLQVTPKSLTLTAESGASKVYGSTHHFSGTAFTQVGLEAWDRIDSVSLSSDGAPATANVGFYDIALADAQGVGLGNYAITYVAATNGLQVTPKSLTLTATGGASKVYGGTHHFSDTAFTQTGLETWDRIDSVSLNSEGALATANVGLYDIAIASAQGAGLGNYTIAYVDARNGLQVTPAALTIVARDARRDYDGTPWYGGNGLDYTGFVNGEGASVLSGSLIWGGDAQGAVAPGEYTLSAGGLRSDNYDISWADGQLRVEAVLPYVPGAPEDGYGGAVASVIPPPPPAVALPAISEEPLPFTLVVEKGLCPSAGDTVSGGVPCVDGTVLP